MPPSSLYQPLCWFDTTVNHAALPIFENSYPFIRIIMGFPQCRQWSFDMRHYTSLTVHSSQPPSRDK